REIAAIERLALRVRDLCQRSRDRRRRKYFTRSERATAGKKVFGETGHTAEDRDGIAPFLRDDRTDGVAIARVTNGRGEQIGEGQLAEAARERHPARYRTGNGHGIPPGTRHRLETSVAFGGPRRGCAARSVQTRELATVPHQRKQVAAEA